MPALRTSEKAPTHTKSVPHKIYIVSKKEQVHAKQSQLTKIRYFSNKYTTRHYKKINKTLREYWRAQLKTSTAL